MERLSSLDASRGTARRGSASVRYLFLSVGLVAGLGCCSTDNGKSFPEGTPLMKLNMKNLVIVDDRVATAGQPTRAQFEALPSAGYRHVISLRGARELETGWEEDVAAELDVDFLRLEIDGTGDLDEAHARTLGQALKESGEPTLVYCRSGARAGALLALQRHFVEGLPPAEALELGRRAGMASAEPAVRKVLGIPDGEGR